MYVSDVAEIGRVMNGNKALPIVLYCNGPFCGKSSRLADELLAAGHTNVRRYQLGIPVWRALGGVTVIESEGLRHVIANDPTTVVIDVREVQDYRAGTLPRARHLPRSAVLEGKDVGEVKRAKDDGRLPMEDHNTRVVVIGRDAAEARYVAEALAREAFHNVSYYAGSFADAQPASFATRGRSGLPFTGGHEGDVTSNCGAGNPGGALARCGSPCGPCLHRRASSARRSSCRDQ